MRVLSLVRPVVRLTCLAGVLAACAPSGALALDVAPSGATITVANSNHGNTLWPGDTFNLSTSVQNNDANNQHLTGVSGTLAGDPAALSFGSTSSTFPDLTYGVPAANNTPFTGTLSPGYECGAPVPLSLNLHTDQGTATLPYTLPTGTAGAPHSYDSSGLARQIPDPGNTVSTIHVADTGRVKHLNVRIGQITHSYDSDLRIEIIAPDGTSATLVNGKGGAGHDFTNTVFDDDAAQSIDNASAPFTGTYRPEQALGLFDGKQMAGDWTLKVTDQVPNNSGVLVSWGQDLSPATCSPEPVASFTATPNPAAAGATVSLDAKSSFDPVGSIVKYEWDLDGNGSYETVQQGAYGNGGAGQLSQTFPRGTHAVGLRVTDDRGHTATKSVTVNVGTPPVVSLSASPAAPQTGQIVTFTADAHSPDAGGSIARYQWDLNGDGTFETDTGSTPTVYTSFNRSGPVTVGVRVIDDAGVASTGTVQVTVTDPPPPSGGGTGGGTTGGGATGGGATGGGATGGGTSGGGTAPAPVPPAPMPPAPVPSAPIPSAPVPPAPFVGVLGGSPIQRLASVASRGAWLTCRANRTGRCSLTLQLTATQARRMHLRVRRGARMVTMGGASVSLAANRTAVVRLRLTRSAQSALRRTRMRSVTLLVAGTIRDSAGHSVRVNRVILLRR